MKAGGAFRRKWAVGVALLLWLPAAFAASGQRIRLPLPGESVRVAGELRGMNDRRVYIFRGVRGTKVKIELSGAGPLRGVVTFPSGRYEGGPGGSILDQQLTETGWFQLRVSESTMGEAWKGAFAIEISVAP